jgi:hypothetical protein
MKLNFCVEAEGRCGPSCPTLRTAVQEKWITSLRLDAFHRLNARPSGTDSQSVPRLTICTTELLHACLSTLNRICMALPLIETAELEHINIRKFYGNNKLGLIADMPKPILSRSSPAV